MKPVGLLKALWLQFLGVTGALVCDFFFKIRSGSGFQYFIFFTVHKFQDNTKTNWSSIILFLWSFLVVVQKYKKHFHIDKCVYF